MSAALVMGTRGLPVLASCAGGSVGVPVCELGGRRLESDFRRSAVDCGLVFGAAVGVAAAGGVGCAEGAFARSPLFEREARRSPPLNAGVEAA